MVGAVLNKIMIIGNVGNDPEMRYTPSGEPTTTFRIATNRTYTSQGEKRKETEWFTVVTWKNLAEQVSNYLTKGRRVYVEGRFRSRTWQAQDGSTRFVNEIIANQVLFLDRAPQEGAAPAEETGTDGAAPAGAATEAEDLPF